MEYASALAQWVDKEVLLGGVGGGFFWWVFRREKGGRWNGLMIVLGYEVAATDDMDMDFWNMNDYDGNFWGDMKNLIRVCLKMGYTSTWSGFDRRTMSFNQRWL